MLPVIVNPGADRAAAYGQRERRILSHATYREAAREIMSWPDYAPTPLRQLNGLAKSAGLGEIWYKDESGRFGLGSFKALGGAYAVFRVLAEEVKRRGGASTLTSNDLRVGAYGDITSTITVTCASAGNHGRSVAWGAELFGCNCVVYLHYAVRKSREAAIASHGAQTVRIAGTYDDAVRRADSDAERQDRIVVSDTSYPGYSEIPKHVMQGYTVMVSEALEQLGDQRPTHVFVQGGVGGLAAAVCAHLWEAFGEDRPTFVVVEPDVAACLYLSAAAGQPTKVGGDLDTIMSGLAAGEVSMLAWRILERGVDAFMTIEDSDAEGAMRLLAKGSEGDPSIVAGESGAAGLAGVLAVAADEAARGIVGLDTASGVFVIGTEGATDPGGYERIVGQLRDSG